jgi:general stress protein 26
MTEKIFDTIKNEFKISLNTKNHPYKLATLGTVGLDHMARLRTIVIRDVSKDLMITFYTDKRSKKVTHIQENNKVSLLFYHPEKSIQLKIEGIASLIKNPNILEEHWTMVSERSKKDYTTTRAPGSGITNSDGIEYLNETHHFCMISIQPKKIEYLKLNADKHTRIRYSSEMEKWHGEFLVP